jgi:predicted RNase H-like HicB family nuclease
MKVHEIIKRIEAERDIMHKFLVIIERAGNNFSAYSPDLPGCVATGDTREEVEANMYEALQMHVEGLQEDGLPIPDSESFAEYVLVKAS